MDKKRIVDKDFNLNIYIFLTDPGKHMTHLQQHTEVMGREMEKG